MAVIPMTTKIKPSILEAGRNGNASDVPEATPGVVPGPTEGIMEAKVGNADCVVRVLVGLALLILLFVNGNAR